MILLLQISRDPRLERGSRTIHILLIPGSLRLWDFIRGRRQFRCFPELHICR